jgi:hypothetical protein
MASSTELAAFAEELRVDANQRLAAEPEAMVGDMFVRVVSERLIADGALEDIEVCYMRLRGRSTLEVSGYNISGDGTVLDLVTRSLDCRGETITKAHVETMFRRAAAFAEACRDGLHTRMEESSPAFDMAQRINESWEGLSRIRIFLLTDGRATLERLAETTVAGLPAAHDIWDVTRLHRLATSGRLQEEIIIDLQAIGQPIPVLESPKQSDGYRCLLAVFPGQLLADLYEEHHGRLLQRNVRAYLQARGKVNKAIHETIRSSPGRFLAYNNGISATATAVEIDTSGATAHITRLNDLQIVNGGQTTASLHHAATKKINLSDVHVMAKITVVPGEMLDEMVPSISRYANSQNAIRPADFDANGPFHVGLERVSRSVWAPAVQGSTRQTRWYYERARGQYQVERGRHSTRAGRRKFEEEYPPKQRFGKTDAAKYEMAYLRQPQVVSLGAEKCFHEWTTQCGLADQNPPDQQHFQCLVAKGIIFQGVRDRVLTMRLGGYPGQTAAYVMALIVDRLGGGVDLDAVWRAQDLPDPLANVVPELTNLVRRVIIDPPDSANVTEWCKKEKCWQTVRQISWTPPDTLVALGRSGLADSTATDG